MRYSGQNQGVSARFVAGTYVVLMGFDATDAARKGLLGFSVHRADETENEQYWLKGFRTFEETFENPPSGSLVSTQEHPVQDFVWSDFTAKPDHQYIYKVVPVYGQPKNLTYGPAVEVKVATEKEADDVHSVYFNRGVVGSQAYAREFHNVSPDKLQGAEQVAAFKWLSRGLEEAMLAFVAQASRRGFGLRAAVYEFSYEPVIAALGKAQKQCQDVQIVYDARIPSGAKAGGASKKRVAAVKRLLKKYGLTGVSTPRTDSGNYISHNKFIVLLKGAQPVAVWTGSTNFTESGIFGQSNVGHVVRDPEVAKAYLDYWTRLQADPAEKQIRSDNNTEDPDIAGFPPASGTTCIFSPRTDLKMLDWYAGAMGHAKSLMCFTAAFGVNNVFLAVLQGKQQHLNYIFLDKWGVNKTLSEKTQKDLGADAYNQVAVGGYLDSNVLKEYLASRWEKETFNPLSTNVRYVHTKYLLVNALSEDPIVVTGSANFSDASTKNNDENMLVIRGDKRVADIYLGEFMRLWQHYRFRYIENKLAAEGTTDKYQPNYLDPTPAWTDPYYKNGSVKYMKRKAFAAPLTAVVTA
jgi:phosphatidylserine/phosphatidylglycerophosphate/cardiolipin synthase-like enzyme